MKNLLVAILSIVYITTSTGVIVHIHYCMGDISEWGIGSNSNNTCGKCGMKEIDGKDNGCCKDKVKLVKNNADQKNAISVLQITHLKAIEMPASYIEIPTINFSLATKKKSDSHALRRSTGVSAYIRNCVFLI